MPIMPYTSNPQINSTGRSLKEHVFRSQFIAFVVFSSLFPKPRKAKRKINAENRRWTAENVYAFNFPFTAFRLTENVCVFFRMRESENGKRKRYWKPFSVSYSVVDFRNTERGYRLPTNVENGKEKVGKRKTFPVFVFFVPSFYTDRRNAER